MRQYLNNNAERRGGGRAPAMEGWLFSYPWNCIGELNSDLEGRG